MKIVYLSSLVGYHLLYVVANQISENVLQTWFFPLKIQSFWWVFHWICYVLARNHRQIVNNQENNSQMPRSSCTCWYSVEEIQARTLIFKVRHLIGLRSTPLLLYQLYYENDEYFFPLAKPMKFLVEEEESVKDSQEPVFVERLAKLLMMSTNRRLSVLKVNDKFWFRSLKHCTQVFW